MAVTHFIGADENGLGAVLGPMIVTAVLAKADERGARLLGRRPPRWLAKDLDDSKRVVSHGDVQLGEAWARALASPETSSPDELVSRLTLETQDQLTERCPDHVRAQCWTTSNEVFEADPELVESMRSHLERLKTRGVEVLDVKCSVLCSKRLNEALLRGHNRFSSDLHAMERLVLTHHEAAGDDVHAICGKVGAMANYEKFFGPLGDRLRVELARSKKRSAYRFHGLGEVHFVMDADARHPLVMLASVVGKYLRELLMSRVSRWYTDGGDAPSPSGYHDPVTKRFIRTTSLLRKKRKVPKTCFIRESEASV